MFFVLKSKYKRVVKERDDALDAAISLTKENHKLRAELKEARKNDYRDPFSKKFMKAPD